MPRLHSGLATLILGLSATSGAAQAQTAFEEGLLLRSAVQEPGAPAALLAPQMQAAGVPGLALAVLQGGEVIWSGGFGVRRADTATPVSDTTRFQAASLSKPVTGLLAGIIADRFPDRFRLEGDINDYLGEWSLRGPEDAPAAGVSVNSLLRHAGGTGVPGFPGYEPGSPLPTTLEVIQGQGATPAVGVERAANEMVLYSGGGYVVLQHALETTMGESLDQLARRLIFEPVGMGRSDYQDPLPQSSPDRAEGHDRDGRAMPGGGRNYAEDAAAGLWTTAEDLGMLLAAMSRALNGGSSPLSTNAVRSTMETMPIRFPMPGMRWGAGWELRSEEDIAYASMTGNNPGYRARLVLFPATGDGLVVLTNGDAGGRLIDDVVRGVAHEMAWPALGPRFASTVDVDADDQAAVAGTYRFGPGDLVITVRITEAGLELKLPWSPFMRLNRLEDGSWITEDGSDVEFTLSDTGPASVIRLTPWNQPPLEGRRTQPPALRHHPES